MCVCIYVYIYIYIYKYICVCACVPVCVHVCVCLRGGVMRSLDGAGAFVCVQYIHTGYININMRVCT